MKVLIIDDSSQLRKVTQKCLSKLKDISIEFFHASNGKEGKVILQEALLYDNPIDLVILDWHMPLKSGLEFLAETRDATNFKTKPLVIMLTAETYPEQIEACLTYGVVSYITKPFTEQQIQNAFLKAYDIYRGVKNAI